MRIALTDFAIGRLLPKQKRGNTIQTPMTMLRNALGVAEGSSGVGLDRAAYPRSVEFWALNANWRDV